MNAFLAKVVAAAVLGSATPTPAAPPAIASLPLEPLSGRARASPIQGPTIVLFWRADCAPCLLELSELGDLRAAAKPLRVTPVGLQPAALLRAALRKLRLRDGDSERTDADAATTLADFGGAPPRLPLAVAFDRSGRVCGRHTGLLGTDQVRAWAKACGGGDARR